MKSSMVPSCGWIDLCPPSGPPMAQGLPTSSGAALRELFLPLRAVRPMGWIGGRYSTSNPIAAIAGKRSSTSRNVPCRPGCAAAERTAAFPPGQPLEIKLTMDKEKLFVGFNDEKGRYQDNHLGNGRRHELDPLWVRVEVVRITVD